MSATQVITQTPCAKCPFRSDVPIYLRRGRRIEIAEALLNGGEFPCHATVGYEDMREDEDGFDVPDTSDTLMCAGAAKSLLKVGVANQMMRIAERLGMADLERTEERGADVWDIHEWQLLAEGATRDNPIEDLEEEEVETCNTVNENCLAPAGFAVGGGVVYGTEAADCVCDMCGEAVCSECIDDKGLCGYCHDEDDDN